MGHPKMKIEIWSDVICPFCYIGKRNFEQALGEFSESDYIEVEWKSFQLDPNAKPESGVDAYTYLAETKGKTLEWSYQVHQQITEMAAQSGLDYHFDIAQPANTFLAHRLIQLAKTKGKGADAEEALFSAYFTEGRNIQDVSTIIEIGTDLDISSDALKLLVDSDIYSEEVKRDIYEAKQLGINSVPFFVLDNKYGVSGAQPAKTLAAYIEKAFTEWENVNL